MSCSFTEQVSYLIDGELPATQSREVERHLVECAECQQVRADFLNLRSQISSFESSATPEVQRRALAKILGPSVRRESPTWSWALAPAAAFAVLLLVAAVAGVYYLQRGNQFYGDGSVAVASPTPAPDTKSATVDDKAPDKGKVNEPKPEPKESPKPAKRIAPREPKPYEKFAAIPDRDTQPQMIAAADPVRATDPQSMTIMHFEKTETLLRSFRNLRASKSGVDIEYERKRAQQLVFQNMMLRREADSSGDVQSAALLESVEPILIDIANLPDKADEGVVRVINERVQRKNIVALLQVNGATLARALD